MATLHVHYIALYTLREQGAFLSSELNLESELRIDHGPYAANWLQVLKNYKRSIFTAASKAQQSIG
jgi:antirestriction protein ArdC